MAKYIKNQPIEFASGRKLSDANFYNDYEKNSWNYDKGQKGYVRAVYEDYKNNPKLQEGLSYGLSIDQNETYYDVSIGMGFSTIYMVPESALGGVENVKSKVEQIIAEKQANKEFKDVGQRVSGTAKERAAYKFIMVNDLVKLEEDEVLAIDLIKKDRVYPATNNQEQFDLGVTAGAAYLKQELRKAYDPKPIINSKIGRLIYVGLADHIQKNIQQAVTYNDFESQVEKFITNYVDILLKIVDEDKYNEHLDELEKSGTAKLQAEREQLRTLIDEQTEKLLEAHPEILKKAEETGNSSIILKALIELPEAEVFRQLSYEYRDVVEKLKNSGNKFTLSKFSILKSIFPSLSDYSIQNLSTSRVMEATIGSRLINFLKRSSESAKETWATAFDYEPVNIQQNKEYLEKHTAKLKDNLERQKYHKKFLEVPHSLQDLDKFYTEEKRTICYYSLELEMIEAELKGKKLNPLRSVSKSFCWSDVKSVPKMAETFVKSDLRQINSVIAGLEKKIQDLEYQYRQRDANWSWAFENKEKKTIAPKKEISINSGKPLEYIKRTGGVRVNDEDVNIEFLTNTMGFKSVTLGNYVKDKEAREHVRHFIGSIFDLCEVLDVDIQYFTGMQGLSMWFGAAGHGKALAFYRKNGVVINITKTNGDGSIAHEMAHYIDNTLNKIDNPKYDVTAKGSYGSVTEKGNYYQYNIMARTVWNKMRNIFNYIYNKKYPQGITLPSQSKETEQGIFKKVIKANPEGRKFLSIYYKENLEKSIEAVQQRSPSGYLYIDELTPTNEASLGRLVHDFGFKEYEVTFKSKATSFYTASKLYGAYWAEDWELFARAFETYIFDKLDKEQRTNNYLVSGDYFNYPVYPQAHEREDLFVLYEELFKTIREYYNWPKFNAMGRERVDEFIELKTGGNDKGIITPDEGSEVIQKIDTGKSAEAIKSKLKQFLAILKENI